MSALKVEKDAIELRKWLIALMGVDEKERPEAYRVLMEIRLEDLVRPD